MCCMYMLGLAYYHTWLPVADKLPWIEVLPFKFMLQIQTHVKLINLFYKYICMSGKIWPIGDFREIYPLYL